MRLKKLNPFRMLDAEELSADQLVKAKRALVEAEYAKEHYEAEVDKLRKRIRRLETGTVVSVPISLASRSAK